MPRLVDVTHSRACAVFPTTWLAALALHCGLGIAAVAADLRLNNGYHEGSDLPIQLDDR